MTSYLYKAFISHPSAHKFLSLRYFHHSNQIALRNLSLDITCDRNRPNESLGSEFSIYVSNLFDNFSLIVLRPFQHFFMIRRTDIRIQGFSFARQEDV